MLRLTCKSTTYFSKKIFRSRRRRDWILLLGICIVTGIVHFTFYSRIGYKQPVIYEGNYFRIQGKRENLIKLPGCTIPHEVKSVEGTSNLSLIDSSRAQCGKDRPKLTYVRGNVIYGLPPPSSFYLNGHLECCYRGVSRIFGTDEKFEISKSCETIDLHGGTQVTNFSAVVVECNVRGYTYKDLHSIILRSGPKERNLESPNIVMLGLDSIPRHYFQNYMPKTRKYLESLGTYNFRAYTKVGENTFPNLIPFLTGYQESQIYQFCTTPDRYFDFCPFLWQEIKMSTAFIEDSPRLGIFNSGGFINPPCDHYSRPLMQVADQMYAEIHDKKRLFPCVGSTPVEEFVLNQIKALLEADTPLFSFNWLTSVAHDGPELIPYADDLLSTWLQSLDLSNTIFILFSDHGYRYSGNRTSFNGWYNDKLPFLTITLPARVKTFLGTERLNAIQTNTRRLSTPFDVYQTMSDILQLYELKDLKTDVNFTPKESTKTNLDVYRLYGQSLFKEISETRTCEDAGIPPAFCPCADIHALNVHQPKLEEVARVVLDRVNRRLPRRCKTLELSRIIGEASLGNGDMIVGFTVRPGEFHYEAYVPAKGDVTSYRVTRTNPLLGAAWCTANFFWELYCHCSFFANLLEYILGNGVAESSKL